MSAYRLSADEKLAPTDLRRPPRTLRRIFLDQLTFIALFLMVLMLLGIVLYPYMVVNVPSGHVGVLWLRFRGGTVLDPRQLKEEGFRIISPWNQVFLYDLRLQSRTDTYTAISKDGVNVIAGINIRFRLKHDSVPQLHQSVGPDFVTSLVVPEIGNRMREVIADYLAEEVYSTKRQEIQDKIRSRAETMLGEQMMDRQETEDYAPYRIPLYAMLNLVDTLVLGIELPPSIVLAINRKQEQYYISEEYTFRVEREVKESQRKKIEAEGIREFQQIVSQGISDSYLRWRGIEATLQLSQSTNSKVVIIGGGKDGMPIILGNVDAAATPPASAPTPDATPRPTAAPPATTAEKVPAAGLAKPVEKMPTPAEPTVPRTYFPFPLTKSDIDVLWSRLTGPTITEGSGTPPQPK